MLWPSQYTRRIGGLVRSEEFLAFAKATAVVVLLLAILAGLLIGVQGIPEWQVRRASVRSTARNPEGATTPEDVARLQDEMRKTFIQVVGGAFALVALYFTYRRVKVSEQGHITDRYTKAIEQLGALTSDGKPNIVVRLGAIYALERIAFDSPRDHWTIMEVLTAYVRQNAPAPATEWKTERIVEMILPKPPTEIQAILTVLGRRRRGRNRESESQRLDLTSVDMNCANLESAHLERADFSGAYLIEAVLTSAFVEGANFEEAHLEKAHFPKARAAHSIFKGADLDLAQFPDAHLEDANFDGSGANGANFKGAHIEGANFLCAYLAAANFEGAKADKETIFAQARAEGAYFICAHAEGANFSGAHLKLANFRGAKIQGAKFGKANFAGFHDASADSIKDGLKWMRWTAEQIGKAEGWEKATFDEYFSKELRSAQSPEAGDRPNAETPKPKTGSGE